MIGCQPAPKYKVISNTNGTTLIIIKLNTETGETWQWSMGGWQPISNLPTPK
jgi:hypothetical protein